MPVATRSAPQARRRAAEIIDAAAAVFAERGYHGASTQAIADVLGIRQASLYYYFPSKEAALELVCIRGVEGFVEQAAAIAAGDEPAPEKVRLLILGHHLAPMRDRQDYVWVFMRERHHLPDASRRRVGRASRRSSASSRASSRPACARASSAPTSIAGSRRSRSSACATRR